MEGVDSRGAPLCKRADQVTEADLGDLEGHCYDGALGNGLADREGQGLRSGQSVVAGALRGLRQRQAEDGVYEVLRATSSTTSTHCRSRYKVGLYLGRI